MAMIPQPHEILEIPAGESVELTPLRYRMGRMTIRPTWAGAPPEKEVEAIRIWVPPEEKGYIPDYWDITPGHLVQALKGILPEVAGTGKRLKISAFLTRPKDPASKRFRIEVLPPP